MVLMMKKTIKWLGRVLMILSVVIMAQKIWGYRENIEIKLTFSVLIQLVVCCLLYAIVVYLCPYIYNRMLYITTGRCFDYKKVAYIYCKSNVMKYLPGNVMQYIGRNEFAVQEDIPHGKVALATMLEIAVVLCSTMMIAVLFSWSYTVEWVSNFVDINVLLLVAIVMGMVLSVVAILFLFKKRILNYLSEILTFRNILIFGAMVLYNIVIMIINSCIYFYVLSLLGINMEIRYYLAGIGLYALAFILGYITPGVPGGIGIRETVLVHFFSSFVEEAQILTGAVIFRIISVLGDFIGLGIAMVVENVAKIKQK